jgi:AhpD family alkylhydroperoxidase
MDLGDREKIEKIIRDRKMAHADLSANSETYRKFTALEVAAFSPGKLDRKTKELVALGISVALNCESCMEWHVKQALDAGATREEVREALDVSIEMGGGPATTAVRFALKALEYHGGAD